MKHTIPIILLLLCELDIFAQNMVSNSTLERIEKLLLHHEVKAADSLFRQEPLNYGNDCSSYQADGVVGLLFYYQEKYEEAISIMNAAMSKMDSLRLWDCENYLKTAYYIADSFMHLNKLKECETIINYGLVKCVNSYSNCIYAKKLYQLLLDLYKKGGASSAIIEQVHNEIQKIAINAYASNNLTQDGKQIKENFMYFYDYNTNPTISQKDSMYINLGKAFNLYAIREYDEAIRLYQKVKLNLPAFDPQLEVINECLLVMYSSTAQMDYIETLLSEMIDFSGKYKLDYDQYSLNIWVGHNLYQNGHYRLARTYFERCDTFLDNHKELQDWVEKKKNVLSKMVFNCRSLGEYKEVIRYCKEYSKLADSNNYDEVFFVFYNQGLALRALEKYKGAIKVLETLKTYIRKNQVILNKDFIMLNVLLGVCYDRTNRNNDSFECASLSVDVYKKMELDDKSLLGTLYNNLGKAYLQIGEYDKALFYLNLSVGIQIELAGKVYLNTQSYINECKK